MLVTLIVSVILAPAPALANGLPRQLLRGPSGIVLPGRETAVGVVAEALTFDFRNASPNDSFFRPFVTAAYTMQNPSQADETLEVTFFFLSNLGSPYEDFSARWNDQELTTKLDVGANKLLHGGPAGLGTIEMHWLNPSTGKPYAIHQVTDGQVTEAAFRMTVKARESGTLQVRYRQDDSGCDQCNRLLSQPISHYTYLLSPARQWAFFKGLTVQVIAPFGMRVAMEPALTKVGSGQWEGEFGSLPSGEFHLSVRPSWLLPHLSLVIGMLLMVLLTGALVWRRRRASRQG
jgi:hypothetical protein